MVRKDLNYAGESALETIYNQINNNNPPETKQTYDRLMKIIKHQDEVIKYLGVVMMAEIVDVLKKNNRSMKKDILKD